VVTIDVAVVMQNGMYDGVNALSHFNRLTPIAVGGAAECYVDKKRCKRN
jgi:hypothetical protein